MKLLYNPALFFFFFKASTVTNLFVRFNMYYHPPSTSEQVGAGTSSTGMLRGLTSLAIARRHLVTRPAGGDDRGVDTDALEHVSRVSVWSVSPCQGAERYWLPSVEVPDM